MPIPVPQVQQFDVTPMLSAFASGQQTRIGLEDRQRDYERQAESALFRAADLADTPEKWAQFISTVQEQFPDADLSEWSDFSARDAALGQAMDPYQRAQLALSQRQLALQESAAARAAQPSRPEPVVINGQLVDRVTGEVIGDYRDNAGAPALRDEVVNGIMGQRNPETNEFEPYPEWMQSLPGGENWDLEGDLRAEFQRLTGEFNDVDASYRRVQASVEEPSAAGDLALIFNYMKMLDPGSAVRETEFANAQNAGGVPDRIRALYNSLINGQRLSETQRADFFDRAQRLYGAAEDGYNAYATQYTNLANQYEVDPSRVVLPRTEQNPAGTTLAAPGAQADAAPANEGGGGVVGPGEAPIGTRIQMPDGTIQVKTANGWEPE